MSRRNGAPPAVPEMEIADKIASVARPQPSCETCDFMRREGNAMRCYFDPPAPALIGTVPAKIQGAPPQLVIAGLSPEVHPARFCHHHPLIEGRAPGHPDARKVRSPGYGAEELN